MRESCRSSGSRNAVTLIEVVVALVLLATLVAGMVTAYSTHHRQALLAVRKQDAVQAADRLLTQWYASDDPQVPRNGFGELSGKSSYIWRTEIIHQNMIETLPVDVVRLKVFPSSVMTRNGRLVDRDSVKPPKPLAQVDVIVPVPDNRF